jgi:hypothetical protein
MGEVTLVPAAAPTIFPWGTGINDLRYFNGNLYSEPEVAKMRVDYAKSPYNSTAATLESAVEVLNSLMEKAPPGIYFAGNPHYGGYGKWNLALSKAGFTKVPGCAINRVYNHSWDWKAKGHCWSDNPASAGGYDSKEYYDHPWESADGFQHWIHAFYKIVPGFEGTLKFDFSKRNLKATTGDDNNSLWQICYGGRNRPPAGTGYARGEAKNYLKDYARMSKNCGIAMGWGLPECGKWLDEEFFTIATLPKGKLFPKGWTPFLEYANVRFAHNLKKLDTAQTPCPHIQL